MSEVRKGPDILPSKQPLLRTSGPYPEYENSTPPATEDKDIDPVQENTTSEDTSGESVEEKAVKKPKIGINERFSQVTRERREAEARADALADNLAKALEAIDRLTAAQSLKAEEKVEEQVLARPKRADFDDPDDYNDAIIEWTTAKTTRDVLAVVEKKQSEDAARREEETTKSANVDHQVALAKEFKKRRDAFIEDHTDYVAVAEADGIVTTMPVLNAIVESDIGPDIAYWLGNNAKEAHRIAELSPVKQVIAIGRIEKALEEAKKTVVEVSKAPRPTVPVNSNNSDAGEKALDALSTDEYAARRLAQMELARKQRLRLA